jgi:hypothetical protein
MLSSLTLPERTCHQRTNELDNERIVLHSASTTGADQSSVPPLITKMTSSPASFLFLRLHIDHFCRTVITLKFTRECSRLACHVWCLLHGLWLWAHRRSWRIVYWLAAGLLPLLGRSVWALRSLRCHRRLWVCALAVVSVLLRNAERCCSWVLLHALVVLWRWWW